MKICSKCRTQKPKAEFAVKSGILRYRKCLDCQSEYHKVIAEKIAINAREYQKTNAEQIAECRREYKRKYHIENAEQISQQRQDHYRRNNERIKERVRDWQKANPDKCAELSRNRRARVRNAVGNHTAADVYEIFESQLGLCAKCKTRLFKSGKQKYHVDHIMPLALGGSNWPSNLQCLCPSCNLRKGAKHPDVWAQESDQLLYAYVA